MKNPLFKSSLFTTPENFEDLHEMIMDHYRGKETQAAAFHASMVMMNLCHKLVEEAIAKAEQKLSV